MIGTPPPTLASKPIAMPVLLAAAKSSSPCSASSALLPVTTSLPAASACIISLRAGSIPPNSSTTMSTSGRATSAALSRVINDDVIPIDLSGSRLRSAMPMSSSGAPNLRSRLAAFLCSSLTTPVPTVPHPSRAIRTGCDFAPAIRTLPGSLELCGCDAAHFGCGRVREGLLDAANRLASAMLVLDQRETYEAVAIGAESDSRRDRNLGLAQQELGKFQRAHLTKRIGNRRPYEHRGLGLFDRPSGTRQSLA